MKEVEEDERTRRDGGDDADMLLNTETETNTSHGWPRSDYYQR